MAKHVIKDDKATTFYTLGPNSEWVLAKGVTLSGTPALHNIDHDLVTLTIAGKITSTAQGIFSGSADAGPGTDGVTINVEKSGRIETDKFAVTVMGNGTKIDNAGTISSTSAQGIALSGADIQIINSGDITSDAMAGVQIQGATEFSIRNTGLIGTGAVSAVYVASVDYGVIVNGKTGVVDGAMKFETVYEEMKLVNKGSIAEGTGALYPAVSFAASDDILINRGLIDGYVEMGDGDDFADLRKGDLGGAHILGGDGDDTFVVSDAATKIFEFGNGGSDTLKTTVDYTLGNLSWDDIEILEAIGKKNISLTGNDEANVLRGNLGNNMMSGGGSNDILAGFGGKDMLTGGMGADHFYFYKKGGIDTLTDFVAGEDVIHIISIAAIDSFEDLEKRMSSVDFDGDKDTDTVIDLGGGARIRLTDVAVDDLAMSDFSIFPA